MNRYFDDEDRANISSIYKKGKRYAAVSLIAVALYFSLPFYTVNPGYAAVHLRLGKVVGTRHTSGAYFKIPFVDSIIPIDMRIRKSVIKTEAFSHDLQTVDLEVAINHRVLDPLLVFKDIGSDYEQVVIDPFTQESVKAIIATFSAEELTQQRNKAKEMVNKDLANSLAQVHVKLVDFNFIHADFHHDFIRSVERKQIAEQSAKKAKYETEEVKEIAIQTKMKADAEAYALKAQKEVVTPQLVFLKAIEKWDGKLPRVATSSALMQIPLGD